MASLAVTYPAFAAATTIVSAQVNQNDADIVNYINARNSASANWDAVSTVGAFTSTLTSNQIILGTTRTVTITAPTPASTSRIWTIPDISAAGTFAALEGTQTFSGTKTFSAIPSFTNDVWVATTKKLYLDGGGDTYLVESSGNQIDFDTGGSLALTLSSAQDVYTVGYTDYSATSTVTGWTSFTTKVLYYKKIGKTVWIWFTFDGTSNATSVSFTLPFTVSNTADIWVASRVFDNGSAVTTAGHTEVDHNASTANCFKDWASGAWTNSGRKIVTGQFVYQTT